MSDATFDTDRKSPSREAIFQAATQLFGERGYPATSVRDIAKLVGMLPGSLYAHIDSKESLLLEIIELGVDRFNQAADEVDALELTASQALTEAVRRHLRIVADNPGRTLIVFHQWRHLSPANRDQLLAKRSHYETFFRRTLERGIAEGVFDPQLDVKVITLGILGALNWTPEWYSPTGPSSPDEIAGRLTAGLLGGLLIRA